MTATVLALSVCLNTAHAYTIFYTNCTLPPSTVNYVSSPDTRGSLDIVWNCIATIIACTYSVLHLNLPRRPEHVSPTRKSWVRWENDYLTPALLTFIGIFCPEWIFTIALMECWDATYQLKRLHKSKPETKSDWTLSHMFFANAGGFVLLYRPDEDERAALDQPKQTRGSPIQEEKFDASHRGRDLSSPGSNTLHKPSQNRVSTRRKQTENKHSSGGSFSRPSSDQVHTQAHAECDLESGFPAVDQPSALVQRPTIQSNTSLAAIVDKLHRPLQLVDMARLAWDGYCRYHLTAAVVRVAIENGLLPAQAVPEQEISDRAKTDWFAKLIVILQLISFFSIVLARVSQDLPICPLEVATSAFAVCSVVTYVFLYYKPQGAYAPLYLGIYDKVPQEIQELKQRYLMLRLEGRLSSQPLPAPAKLGKYHGRPPFYLVSISP